VAELVESADGQEGDAEPDDVGGSEDAVEGGADAFDVGDELEDRPCCEEGEEGQARPPPDELERGAEGVEDGFGVDERDVEEEPVAGTFFAACFAEAGLAFGDHVRCERLIAGEQAVELELCEQVEALALCRGFVAELGEAGSPCLVGCSFAVEHADEVAGGFGESVVVAGGWVFDDVADGLAVLLADEAGVWADPRAGVGDTEPDVAERLGGRAVDGLEE
jgi:hypothetical protein